MNTKGHLEYKRIPRRMTNKNDIGTLLQKGSSIRMLFDELIKQREYNFNFEDTTRRFFKAEVMPYCYDKMTKSKINVPVFYTRYSMWPDFWARLNVEELLIFLKYFRGDVNFQKVCEGKYWNLLQLHFGPHAVIIRKVTISLLSEISIENIEKELQREFIKE